MFLKETRRNHLVEILDLEELIDPYRDSVNGRLNIGEDLPEPETFPKADLVFPSGESLPRCWMDPHYRDDEFAH